MSDNIQKTIVDLLNQASIYGKDHIRVQHLRHVQELILRKDPTLLDHFLEEVLAFQTDKSVEVKKTIISFLEEACQMNPKIVVQVIDNLHFLLHDDNIFVQKKLILSFISVYKSTLTWFSKSSPIDETVDRVWRTMVDMKNHILSQLNSNNDGLCLVVIKFIELLITIFIQYEQDLPLNDLQILSRNQLEQEEKDMMGKLIDFLLSQHSSDVQLIAAIEALTNITRYRADYISRIVSTLEILQENLSLTFNDSQIIEIRKIMKLKLSNLLKYSVSSDSQSQIMNLLTSLGSTQAEILKYLPKRSSEPKRKSTTNNHPQTAKKFKNTYDHTTNGTEKQVSLNNIQQTVTDLMGKLSMKNVVDLVLASMQFLPEIIPTSFQSTYTPIRDAGSPAQIEYLARLLAIQLTAAGHDMILLPSSTTNIDRKANLTSTNIKPKKIKPYKLLNAIKPIKYNEMQRMSMDSFHRILYATDLCGKVRIHQKIISSLVCLFEESFRDVFQEYIFADIHQRYDLALAWIYEEYVHANGYLIRLEVNQKKDFTRYDYLLCQLLEYLQEKDHDLFFRLVRSAPLITNNALLVLERYYQNENCSDVSVKILRDFILHRTSIREKCLDILFSLTQNRNDAIQIVKILYKRNEFQQAIERYALQSFNVVQTSDTVFDVSNDVWPEDSIHRCFSLCLHLIPLNHCLIQPFANLYIVVNGNTQRRICQVLETPVREMGMASSEVLKLIRNCPKGAETLIIHIIHILTEQLPPSDGLVESIRVLYHEWISDVRLLIPILPYLEKCEIKNALPAFIKSPASVVEEVFSQLLGLKSPTQTTRACPISPSELFIALHEISLEECELKIIINATTLCFNQRSIYTDTMLAEIIQYLVEMTPIPLLFMRTVLQTLGLYPKMVPFMMKILQRLITKQAWKQTRIWEGFIKCCEITRPHSLPLLLQLPIPQLKHVCQTALTLQDSLRHYLRSMSMTQRSSIPSSILEMIENN